MDMVIIVSTNISPDEMKMIPYPISEILLLSKHLKVYSASKIAGLC